MRGCEHLAFNNVPKTPPTSECGAIVDQNLYAYPRKLNFAANQAFGLVEPHADWNQLMRTPALDAQGKYSTFGGEASLYPGDELQFELVNSTIIRTRWLARYEAPGLGPH